VMHWQAIPAEEREKFKRTADEPDYLNVPKGKDGARVIKK